MNGASEEEGDTPLHVAARLGLAEQVGLLLQHGADLEAPNAEGETPLIAACSLAHSSRAAEAHFDVCRQLVEAGARVNAADRDRQRPLHQASKNANARVVALLLARGANVNIMSYSGNTALHNALQVAAYRLEHQPELAVRHLLNHGAVRVWPGALLKVGSGTRAEGCWAPSKGSKSARPPLPPPKAPRGGGWGRPDCKWP